MNVVVGPLLVFYEKMKKQCAFFAYCKFRQVSAVLQICVMHALRIKCLCIVFYYVSIIEIERNAYKGGDRIVGLKDELIELRKSTGMNKRQFSEYFGIPYRTFQDWELGNRRVPEYLFRLMAYTVRMEGLVEEKGEDST